ncbi:uncharacterized protein [Linepithema humile]|uniref:uncharacterized protein isoform X2 n=1 Tax=Linepithema humile TaxID=83485 RepID=UPI00351E47AB
MENFHFEIFRKFDKTHTNVWNFLHNLKGFIAVQEKKIAILTEGRTVKRTRVRYDMNRDKRITEAQSLLSSGRYSLKEFLLALSNIVQLLEENIDLQNDVDNDIDQEIIDGNFINHFARDAVIDSQNNIDNDIDREIIEDNFLNDFAGGSITEREIVNDNSLNDFTSVTATALLETTAADSVLVTDNIERTPLRRGRPPRIRGRNLSRAAEITATSQTQVTDEALLRRKKKKGGRPVFVTA